MKKISSTGGRRIVVIAVSLGAVGVIVAALVPALVSHKVPVEAVLAPLFAFGVVALFLYGFFRGVVDEVWDDGDALVVKNGGREFRIPLAEIVNLNYSQLTNPPRATLLLRNPTLLGREIVFLPVRPFSLNPFARNPAMDELILRIDARRRLH